MGSLGFGALDLRPQRGVGLFEGDRLPLEFALGVFEVLVDIGLVVQVERNRPVDLRALQQREVFLNRLWRLPLVERVSVRQWPGESRQ